MNSRIQHLINKPFEVQVSDVALLQDEIEKYPYFSTLRTLLLFGLKEFDHGRSSGWMYKVNGTPPNIGAGAYRLKAGDQVIWYYVNIEQ